MPGIHSNSFKMLFIETQEGLPILILVNLIQCRGTEGMFNNHNIASKNLKHSCSGET